MDVLKYEDYTIEVFTTAKEWGTTFYGMPDDVACTEEELKEMNGEINGFACIADKTISLYVPDLTDLDEVETTIAHEVGHIIEGGFKKNPPDKPRYNKKHEVKANHYEDYYNTVKNINKLVQKKIEEYAKV